MFRRTSVVQVVDELARAQRRERERAELMALLVGVAWTLWRVRVELALVLVLAAVQRSIAGVLGDVGGTLAVAVVVGVGIGVAPSRRFALRLLWAMRVRRAWARAAID